MLRRIAKTTTALIFGIALTNLLAYKTYAEKKFETDYQTVYDLSATGETTVSQEISITNLQNDAIASKYAITLSNLNIYAVTARDENGVLTTTVENDDNTVTISVRLNSYTIGKGRQGKFTIAYKTKDIATKLGEIWNINIPRTAPAESTNSYNTALQVPKTFGPKIFVSPTPATEKETAEYFSYFFTKENTVNNGISAAFGKYQVLNFKLKYQIQNASFFPRIVTIALPPDIKSIQHVKYSDIYPFPKKLELDQDGNVIASYLLKGKQQATVSLTGSAMIIGRQINPDLGGKPSEINRTLAARYTKPQKYWESKSTSIQTLAQSLFEQDQNVSQNAKQIYDYIVQKLTYDFDVVKQDFLTRKGAELTLIENKPTACMGFTDLFIATARAMKIPARELNGYAYSIEEKTTPLSINFKSGDFLHAWPEYYDPNFGWVQIDPTWGTTSGMDYFTKLDTNRLVFVIKGTNSEHPLPAGIQRIDPSEHLVEVDFSQNPPEETAFSEKLVMYKRPTLNLLQLLLGRRKFEIKNEGDTFIYDVVKHTLAPRASTEVFLPKDTITLTFSDFNGTAVTKKVTVIQ